MVPPAETARSKHHRFPGAMISHSVWLSYRFSLRDRDVEAMLVARGIVVTYTYCISRRNFLGGKHLRVR